MGEKGQVQVSCINLHLLKKSGKHAGPVLSVGMGRNANF